MNLVPPPKNNLKSGSNNNDEWLNPGLVLKHFVESTTKASSIMTIAFKNSSKTFKMIDVSVMSVPINIVCASSG